MTSTINMSGRRVESGDDQSVLESLLRAGVYMPNSCNQGTCGSCKLQIVSGEVDHRGSPQDTLSAEERAQGLALACQARPLDDVEVSLCGSDEAGSTHVLRDLTGTVASVEDIARDTRRVLIDLDEALDFSTGQYIELIVPGTAEHRQYSLANTSEERKVLELHVRRVPGGLASDEWLFGTVAVGDRIEGIGPLGDFHAPPADEDTGEPMVLIGGGTGLAPLVGIVRTALSRHPGREVVLYHGVRGESDLYDGEMFAELEAQYAGFRFVPVLSEETSSEHRSGFPTDALLEDISSCRGWSGWLCGPPAMVEAGVKAFKRRRMSPRLIHREKFTPADALTSV